MGCEKPRRAWGSHSGPKLTPSGGTAQERGRGSKGGERPAPRPGPYLEGGVLLHVPQQLWLLGRRVVAHRALKLLPCGGDKHRSSG